MTRQDDPWPTLAAAFAESLGLHQAGSLAQAEGRYRAILTLECRHADSWHLLGVIRHQQGRHDDAVALIGRAIRLDGSVAAYYSNQANAHWTLGRIDLAVILYGAARILKPDFAEAHCHLGLALRQLGRRSESIAAFTASVRAKPDAVDAHYHLGIALAEAGRLEEAVGAFRAVLRLAPDHADAYAHCGLALKHLARPEAALAAFAAALRLAPGDVQAHSNLGVVLKLAGRPEPATIAYKAALCLAPGVAAVYYNLGNALQELGRQDATRAAFVAALRLNPHYAEAHNNLGNARQDEGRVEEAVADYQRALACQPDYAEARMNLAFAQLYRPSVGLADIARHARRWATAHAGGFERPARRRMTGDSPRIGLVSADFRRHAVGWLVIPAIEGLARAGYPLTLYSNSPTIDGLTERFIRAAAIWRPVAGISDAGLADLIRDDGIDILIDLSGYSVGNRLLVFARKPAPIQIAAWVGYPATTGLAAMDYILADRWQIPTGAETHYTEAVIRLPYGIVAFEPPADAPSVGDLPALTRKRITFGSFNVLRKITPDCVALWSRILRLVPDSRLLMKSVALQNAPAQRRYAELFAAQAIGADRLQFLGGSSAALHMASMGQCDIALDSLPYSGGRTTLEALWMGLPVVTLPGESFASRHSLSYLSTIGLSDLVASDSDHYVALAVALANDLSRLADLRRVMRQRILDSPLCDREGFSRGLATALTMIWRRHCDGLPPTALDLG